MIFSKVNVILLDESVETFEFNPRTATGADLLAMVSERLSLYEQDYFGFAVEEAANAGFESKASKPPRHYQGVCPKWLHPLIRIVEGESLRFRVKFYPPHPALALKESLPAIYTEPFIELIIPQEGISRHLLCLQLQRDIRSGLLPCSSVTHAILGAYMVQARLGDFGEKKSECGGDVASTAETVRPVLNGHVQTPAEDTNMAADTTEAKGKSTDENGNSNPAACDDDDGSKKAADANGNDDQSAATPVDPLSYLLDAFAFAPAPLQTRRLTERVAEIYEKRLSGLGMTAEEAELGYLETAEKLSMYGVCAAKVAAATEGLDQQLAIGVCAAGIVVFRDRVIVNRFAWPKVTKVSYNESRFILKLRRSPGERSDTSVAFKMCDRKEASRFWKTCIEHHCFFRFATNEQVKPSWFQILLGRRNFGSRYKYVGRTMLEAQLAPPRPPEVPKEEGDEDSKLVADGDGASHDGESQAGNEPAAADNEAAAASSCADEEQAEDETDEEPPKGFEHYTSSDVKTERVEGMALEDSGGLLVMTEGTQRVTEVVTIKVEKTGDAIPVEFLTPEVIEKANQMVVEPAPSWLVPADAEYKVEPEPTL